MNRLEDPQSKLFLQLYMQVSKFEDETTRFRRSSQVGSSVVNALSLWLEVNVKRDGKIYNQRYEQGKVCYDLKEAGKCRKNDTGTKVSFFPDAEIFEKIYFKADAIKSRLHEIAYLNP